MEIQNSNQIALSQVAPNYFIILNYLYSFYFVCMSLAFKFSTVLDNLFVGFISKYAMVINKLHMKEIKGHSIKIFERFE